MEETLKRWLKAVRMNESIISTLLGVLVVVIVGVLLFNYFKSSRTSPEIEPEGIITEEGIELEQKEGKLVPKGLPTTHIVMAGEHLWSIAEKYYGTGYNWTDIAEASGLSNPDQLEAGQELIIPQAEVKNLELGVGKPEVAGEQAIETQVYTVVRGDDLWKIAVRAYGDGYRWSDIWEANKQMIVDPNLIEVGMQLTLPR